MVLGGEDDAFHACGLEGACPLLAVQVRGVEAGGGSVAVAPLAVGEGVGAEVDEGIGLHLLPGHLMGRGQGRKGSGRVLCGAGEGEQGEQTEEGRAEDVHAD